MAPLTALLRSACRLWLRVERHVRAEIASQKQHALRQQLGAVGADVSIAPDHHWLGMERVHLGDGVFINRGSMVRGDEGLFIGDNTVIGPNVTIWTVNHDIHDDVLPFGSKRTFRPVRIGRNVWIGINVTIVPGSEIGEGAVIGAGTVVSGVVPPFAIIAGAKWRVIGHRDMEHYRATAAGESP